MILIENNIRINQRINKVFDFLSDFRNIPLWNYYVKEVNPVAAEKNNDRKVYHQKRRNDEQYFSPYLLEYPERIGIKTLNGSSPGFKREFYLKEKGDSTQVMDRFELETKYPGMFEKLLKSTIRKAVHDNLQKLKQLLETGRTTLQDGRTIVLEEI